MFLPLVQSLVCVLASARLAPSLQLLLGLAEPARRTAVRRGHVRHQLVDGSAHHRSCSHSLLLRPLPQTRSVIGC